MVMRSTCTCHRYGWGELHSPWHITHLCLRVCLLQVYTGRSASGGCYFCLHAVVCHRVPLWLFTAVAHMANKMHAWSSLLLQDHLGRAEGYNIVHADKQFIVPTDGKPIRGLIQDHVVAGVEITCRWGPAAAEPHLFVVTRVLVVLGLLGPHATSCRSD